MRSALVLVDVHLGADDDRDACENRGEPAVQACREQERVHDVRLRRAEIRADAGDVERTPQSRLEAEDVDGRSGCADLIADRARLVDAADPRLESRRQTPHEIEHHVLGAADHERVSEIDHADAAHLTPVAWDL